MSTNKVWTIAMGLGLVLTAYAVWAQQAQDGWIALFNGKDMTGWTKMNNGNWTVEDGVLKYTGGGNGWLRTNEKFTDFHLIFEWRYSNPEGNRDSGLLRPPRSLR